MESLALEVFCPFTKNHKDYSGNGKHFFTLNRGFHRTFPSVSYVVPSGIGSFNYDEKFTLGGWFTYNWNGAAPADIISNLDYTTDDGVTVNKGYILSTNFGQVSFILTVYNNTFDYGYLSVNFDLPKLSYKSTEPNHYIITYDGSGTANGINFYFNGVKLTSKTIVFDHPFSTKTTYANNFKLMDGSRGGFFTPVNSFYGRCNFLRIYRNEITAKHINQIYQSELEYFTPHKFSRKEPYPTWTNALTLYLSAYDVQSNNCTLYLRGTQGTEELESTTLFLEGSLTEAESTTLYLYAKDSSTDNITLYLYGTYYHDETLNLFVQADDKQESGIDLFLQADLPVNQPHEDLTLFVKSYDNATVEEGLWLYNQGGSNEALTTSLNLFVGGAYSTIEDSIPLYIANTQLGQENNIPLFVQGDGLNEGYTPYYESMPMYIERLPAAMIPLYCATEGVPNNSSISLLIKGFVAESDGVDLVIKDSTGQPTDSIKLFTHGF